VIKTKKETQRYVLVRLKSTDKKIGKEKQGEGERHEQI